MGRNIDAVLLDLDGVLYVGNEAITGAHEALHGMQQTGLNLAGVTNTTTHSRSAILDKLQALGFMFSLDQLYTPAALAVQRIGSKSAALFVGDLLREDFTAVQEATDHADFVVMGDIGGEGYPPEELKRVFHLVMDGAQVLALHKNRFWQKPDGLHLDLGVFVAAIEYATGKQAEVLGKPSHQFFHMICEQLGVTPARTLMVGDDIESDIGGARDAGLITVLVETGKYRKDFVKQTGIKPDLLIPSIADLPEALALL